MQKATEFAQEESIVFLNSAAIMNNVSKEHGFEDYKDCKDGKNGKKSSTS